MNDQSESTQFWARKGETVCCVKGHAICDIAHDIMVGDSRSSADFTNWKQPEPDKSTNVADIRCATCRGAWINGNKTDGYRFHFAEGWR